MDEPEKKPKKKQHMDENGIDILLIMIVDLIPWLVVAVLMMFIVEVLK